jgi:glycosyltransferase involved in cell wall biosynthesis
MVMIPHPTISVVIPAYNSTATLPRALDSVFAQTCTDFEIVIVDDGSKDDITAALAPYLDRVNLIRQPNRGAAAARNRGVAEARGRLLAFLDADDFWHHRKLELQLPAFQQRPDISLCWTMHVDWQPGQPMPDGKDVSATGLVVPQYSSDFNTIFLDPYLGTPGVMMPKAVFQDLGGFREHLRSAEDIDLWLRAAHRGTTALIPRPLFYRVMMPNSLTAQRKDSNFQDNLQVIEEFCADHPQFASVQASTVKRAKARVYEQWGSCALVDGDSQAAAKLLFRSLRNRLGSRAAYLWTKTVARRIVGG